MRIFPRLAPALAIGAMIIARAGYAQPAVSPALSEGPTNTAVGQGALASTTTGSFNTATGAGALTTNVDGNANTASGFDALRSNVAGHANTAIGAAAMAQNAFGSANTAVGDSALYSNTDGLDNVAVGNAALFANGVGAGNTAVGGQALTQATGHHNTAIGLGAGSGVASGAYNIHVGSDVGGAASDANTIRIGLPYDGLTGTGQNRTFVAGVAGTVLTNPAVPVFVDGFGQLGTLVPAPFSGSITQPVQFAQGRPDAAASRIDALEAMVREQRAAIAALRQQLERLTASRAHPSGRR
jgi:hypothetical protein